MKNDINAFQRALTWCGVTMLLGLVGQHAWGDWRDSGNPVGAAVLGAVVLAWLGAGAWSFLRGRKGTLDFLMSYPFLLTLLTAITLFTTVGTLVLQQAPPRRFEEVYQITVFGWPINLVPAFRFLFLEDLFHAWWFEGLIVLMALSLTIMGLRRKPFTWRRVGYTLAHLGIVVALLGALVGYLTGVKGRIDIEVGQKADHMLKPDWRTGRRVPVKLPFEVRLDDFHIETYTPVYRVFVFKRTGSTEEDEKFTPVVSIDPVKEQGRAVAVAEGWDLRVDRWSAEAPKSGPGSAQAGEGRAAAAEKHLLVIDNASYPVEPGQEYADLGGYHVAVATYYPHFTYDIEAKQAGNVSNDPKNPALKVTIRKGGPQGEVKYNGWLFANMPGFSMAQHNQEDGQPAWVPLYQHEGGGAAPGADGPRVTLSVIRQGGATVSKELTLAPGQEFVTFDEGRLVGVFRLRDDEAKNYYSKLSVLEGGQAVATEQIFVNAPMSYQGWSFYQSNYDPDNLRYSGVEVSKDPGLGLVYAGMLAMMFGVVQVFYLRTLGRKKEVA